MGKKSIYKSSKKIFLEKLAEVGGSEQSEDNFESITNELQHHLIEYLSDNHDNRETSKFLKYGEELDEHGPNSQGMVISIGKSDFMLSEIIYSAAESDIPQSTLENYPGITQEVWEQALRISWAILHSLEWDELDDPAVIKEWVDSINPR